MKGKVGETYEWFHWAMPRMPERQRIDLLNGSIKKINKTSSTNMAIAEILTKSPAKSFQYGMAKLMKRLKK